MSTREELEAERSALIAGIGVKVVRCACGIYRRFGIGPCSSCGARLPMADRLEVVEATLRWHAALDRVKALEAAVLAWQKYACAAVEGEGGWVYCPICEKRTHDHADDCIVRTIKVSEEV